MATTSLETRRPYSEKKQLVVRINERRSANVPGALQCARCDDGTGKLARCAFWVQGIIALLVLVWIGYAHARLLAYDRELEQITRHVTVLQKHVNRLRLVNKYGGSVMVDDGKHSLHDATNVEDVGLDLPNTSHVTQSRTRRAGRHHSPVDDELQTKPGSQDDAQDQELNLKQRQQCSSSASIKVAEITCHRSIKLVSDVKRYLIAVIKRTNVMTNRQTRIGQHPSIHLAAIPRPDIYLSYLAWNTSNPMSHVTGSDGRITGRDQAYHVDGTRELVNITASGRYLVYAQVTFMGRNISKDSLETLDCGFRIVIARSRRYNTNNIGLFSAQSTQYELGRTKAAYVQDSAYVSGVYVFQAGDELAIDIDRGVNSGDICRVNYDAAKTFFGIFWLGSTHLE